MADQEMLANWLGILQANKSIAGGGTLAEVIDDKDAAREALLAAISRVRFYYSSASDDRDQTPELAKIGSSRGAIRARRSRSRCRRHPRRRPSTRRRAS